MTLLDAGTIAQLRALARRGMTLTADILRPAPVVAGKAGPTATAASAVPLAIWAPHGDRVAVLQDLGGGRANRFGAMPWSTDVRPGDLLAVGAARWHVHGVDASGLDQVLLALSQQVGA